MSRAAYKGYIINPRPHQLAEDGRWSTDLYIEHHDVAGVEERTYSGVRTFESKDEAIQHSLRVGAQIIDGVYPGCVAP